MASAERLGIWLELANKYLEIKKRDIGLLHNDEYLITQIKKYRTLNKIGKKDHSLYTSIFRYKKQYLLTNLGN